MSSSSHVTTAASTAATTKKKIIKSAISEQQHHVEQTSTTATEQKSLTTTKKITTKKISTASVITKESHEIKSSGTNGVAIETYQIRNDVGAISGVKKAIKSNKTEIGNNTDVLIQSNKQQQQQQSTAEDVNNQIYDESTTTDNIEDEVQQKKSKKKKKSKVTDDSNTEPGGTAVKEKRKKSKKSKKSSDPEKENISVRSSFSKFDALQKKNILHVRSTDPAKAQEKFNGTTELDNDCKSCGKVVFQMEQIKAEKSIWHKNCFRCSVAECSKQLNVDTYQSHDGILFCKPHFKALFSPKAVEDNEPVKPRKHELIIRENQPVELPPDVVRSSDKPDLGLDEIQALNVKERFQMFENPNTNQTGESGAPANDRSVKRSTSILSKLAKFQSKGMNIGDESLNGVPVEQSDDEEGENEDESEEEGEANGDVDLVRSKKIKREKPMSFASMNEMKTKFEHGHSMTKEERREERKQEISNIRSRLFMGKQARIKEMYQQAVADSEVGIVSTNRKPDIEIGDKAKSIKERFEKGEAFVKKNEEDEDEQRPSSRINGDEQAVFEQGISKKSRSIFLEMDATAAKSGPITPSPLTPTPRTPDAKYRSIQQSFNVSNDDVVKCEDKVDDVKIETSEISSKFKFFETYRPDDKKKKEFRITPPRDGVVKDTSPDREIYRDPDVIRGDDPSLDDPVIAEKSQTAKKMLSIFRQLEEKETQKPQYEGLKPLKRFTPPPDEGRRMYKNDSESEYSESESEDDDEEESSEEESENEQNPSYVKSTDKFEDEFLKQAQSAERAKQLRAKFEKWESNELKREKNSGVNLYEQNNDESQVESAKSIRAKFETMRDSPDMKEKRDRIKVNRFV